MRSAASMALTLTMVPRWICQNCSGSRPASRSFSGVRKEATAYLQYLYSEAGQELVAKHYLRPRSAAVAKKYAASFKPISLFTIDDVFGGWKQAQKKHFDDGGEFDKIYQK